MNRAQNHTRSWHQSRVVCSDIRVNPTRWNGEANTDLRPRLLSSQYHILALISLVIFQFPLPCLAQHTTADATGAFVDVESAAGEPTYVGRAGCATATCHGGIVGQGPMWNQSASRWDLEDRYHSSAGSVLKSDLSERIVAALIGSAPDSETFRSQFSHILQKRCVSCHAPQAIHSGQRDDMFGKDTVNDDGPWQTQLAEGVSCEDCHGPASKWLVPHTRLDWKTTSAEAREAGMLDTETWLKRVANCARCHVGSRTEDGLIRDMNHDMIAAGHPPLRFDMTRFQANLPVHWDVPAERQRMAEDERLPQPVTKSQPIRPGKRGITYELAANHENAAARLLTLSAAARLASERISDSLNSDSHVPRPEFSDFDCAACHRSLLLGAGRHGASLTGGRPSWNPWYIVSSHTTPLPPQLLLGDNNMLPRLQTLTSDAGQQAQTTIESGTTGLAYPPNGYALLSQLQDLRTTLLNAGTRIEASERHEISFQLDRLTRRIEGSTPAFQASELDKHSPVLTAHIDSKTVEEVFADLRVVARILADELMKP